MTPFPFRKAHFIGLAGVGMSATAILLRDSGVAVTGSERSDLSADLAGAGS
jgi:UDP-N-acetylmuramate: L-alanyl-gamma-D-glutamyl-meso-diaminopimelate ligase